MTDTFSGQKSGPAKFKASAVAQAVIARDTAFIEKLVVAQQAREVQEAAKLGKELGGLGAQDKIDPMAGLGSSGTARRFGGLPTANKGNEPGYDQPAGFEDPLAGASRRNHPHSTQVGAPGVPTGRDLVSQDGGGSPDTGTHSQDRGERHGSVWVERHTERQSGDGMHTWGSTLYTDTSGNFWRADYHEERGSDGGVTTKDTVFDNHGEPIKTTIIVMTPDGHETETTTNHQTGETHTVDTTPKPESPDKGGGKPKLAGYEPDETNPRGDTVAPRGWYNPISGVAQNPGLATSSNQVNPGREGDSTSPAPQSPLRIDPKILVVNPLPEADQARGTAAPRNIQTGNPTIVDPPRPQ